MRMISLRSFSASASKSEQDPGRDTLVLANEAEQDVLGTDVVVAERQRLALREVEHIRRVVCERDLVGDSLVALAHGADDLRPRLLRRDPERPEHLRRHPFLLAEQAEQDVLGAYVVVPERPRRILGKHNNLPGTFRKPLKHVSGGYRRDDAVLGQCSGMTPDGVALG
jgi:hypothetical protein